MEKNAKNQKKEWKERLQVIQLFHKKSSSLSSMQKLLADLIQSSAFRHFAQKVPSLMQFYFKQQGHQIYQQNSETVAQLIQV